MSGPFCRLLGLFWSAPTTRLTQNATAITNHSRSAELRDRKGKTRSGPDLHEFTAKLPLSFEQNVGQLDSRAKFSARGAGYNLFLTSTGALLELRKSNYKTNRKARGESSRRFQSNAETSRALLGFNLQGANANAIAKGVGALPGQRNYFIGNDPAKWHTDVPTFRAVRYEEIYPGISLTYYGNQQQLEYDFAIAPGADPRTIRLGFDSGVQLRISDEGDLVLHNLRR